MTSTANIATKARSVATYFMGAVAFLTCPCHLPVLLILLSGTAVGGLMADNLGLSLLLFLMVFLLSARATWRLAAGRGR